jgi:hypothetical protein
MDRFSLCHLNAKPLCRHYATATKEPGWGVCQTGVQYLKGQNHAADSSKGFFSHINLHTRENKATIFSIRMILLV